MGDDTRQIIRRHVRPGDRVADVGANQGVFTLLLADAVGPTGSVDAFEPDPTLFAALSNNVRQNGIANVRLHACALSDAPGFAMLQRSTLNSGDNRLRVDFSPVDSSPVTSSPVDSSPAAPSPAAPSPAASWPVASSPVASSPVASSPVASSPVASSPVASSPVASSPVAPSPVAPSPVPPSAAPGTASTHSDVAAPHLPSAHPDPSAHLDSSGHPAPSDPSGLVRTRVERLDVIIGDGPLDFLKIDVQGFELHVLRGMSSAFDTSPGLTVLLEFCPDFLRAAGSAPEAVGRLLWERGYTLTEAASARPITPKDLGRLCGEIKGWHHIDLLATRERQ